MTTDFCAVAGFPAAFPIARYRFSARMREPQWRA
jgi:ribosomal protein L37E